MILTTELQAHNFVLFALETDRLLDDLPTRELVENLRMELRNVFGSLTFSEAKEQEIVEAALAVHDERW